VRQCFLDMVEVRIESIRQRSGLQSAVGSVATTDSSLSIMFSLFLTAPVPKAVSSNVFWVIKQLRSKM